MLKPQILSKIKFAIFSFMIAPCLSSTVFEYDFTKPHPAVQLLRGFSHFENWGCWTNSDVAIIKLDLSKFPQNFPGNLKERYLLTFNFRPFLPLGNSELKVNVFTKGKLLENFFYCHSMPIKPLALACSELGDGNLMEILFAIKGACSPFSCGLSQDSRLLGIGFEKLNILLKSPSLSEIQKLSSCKTDFRTCEEPQNYLFKPLTYTLKSINFGEQDIKEKWAEETQISLKGGEIFHKKDIFILADTMGRFITDKNSTRTLLSTGSNTHLNIPHAGLPATDLKGKICIFRLERIFDRYYYEFLLHLLPSIILLTEKYGEDLKFLYPADIQNFEKEAFEAISFKTERLIPYNKVLSQGAICAYIEELLIPNFGNIYWKTGYSKREFYPELAPLLKKIFLPAESPSWIKKRIYISRKDMSPQTSLRPARTIINEEEITSLLKRYDFEVITLTGKSIKDQARIFNEAEAIIAPHGAGLANLVFCRQGTKVLEFIPPKWHALAYFHLSAVMQLNHAFIVGNPIENSPGADFHIDANAVSGYLTDILAR